MLLSIILCVCLLDIGEHFEVVMCMLQWWHPWCDFLICRFGYGNWLHKRKGGFSGSRHCALEYLSFGESVVRIAMLSGCRVWFLYAFKDIFCFNGWFFINFFHQVNICEVVEVVNRYCCAEITLCCRYPPVSWYESWSWSDKLINAYNFIWDGRCP